MMKECTVTSSFVFFSSEAPPACGRLGGAVVAQRLDLVIIDRSKDGDFSLVLISYCAFAVDISIHVLLLLLLLPLWFFLPLLLISSFSLWDGEGARDCAKQNGPRADYSMSTKHKYKKGYRAEIAVHRGVIPEQVSLTRRLAIRYVTNDNFLPTQEARERYDG